MATQIQKASHDAWMWWAVAALVVIVAAALWFYSM